MSNQQAQNNSQWKSDVAYSVAASLIATGIVNIVYWYRRPVTEPLVEEPGERAISERKTLQSFLPNAEFTGQVSTKIHASAPEINAAIQSVTLRDMPLAYWLGSLRYLPGRMLGKNSKESDPTIDQPFMQTLQEGIGNLILADIPHQTTIMGCIGKFHNLTDQKIVRITTPQEFIDFNQPDYQKLAMSLQLTPLEDHSGYRLTLTHGTHGLSNSANQKFAFYWLFIKPTGNFVSWLLLRAIKSIAEKQKLIVHPAQ